MREGVRQGEARRGVRLVAVLGAWAALAVATASGIAALADTVQVNSTIVTFKGTIVPNTLPRRGTAPVTLELDGLIRSSNGESVPRLASLVLEFNRHGTLATRAVPACRIDRIRGTVTSQAMRRCGASLIGSGTASAEIDLPDQPPFKATAPLRIFKGQASHGRQTILVHAYALVPAPATFVTTGTVKPASGQFGKRLTVAIPTITTGQGVLTEFSATFSRLIRAGCPAPDGLTRVIFPLARARFRFQDGSQTTNVVTQGCRVKEP